jgi:hypothetical protein
MTIKKTTQRQGFKTSEFVAYPAHGVGQIVSIEEQEVAGAKLELFVISFIKDKMTLRVPTAKTVTSALIAPPHRDRSARYDARQAVIEMSLAFFSPVRHRSSHRHDNMINCRRSPKEDHPRMK